MSLEGHESDGAGSSGRSGPGLGERGSERAVPKVRRPAGPGGVQ